MKGCLSLLLLLIATVTVDAVSRHAMDAFDFGSLVQTGVDAAGSRACTSRRGYADCYELGPDCTDNPDDGSRSFPMKEWQIDFPCEQPFWTQPIVFTTVLGEKNTKMYSSSVHSVTTSGFKTYIQRTDDVVTQGTDPCTTIKLCYIAIAV